MFVGVVIVVIIIVVIDIVVVIFISLSFVYLYICYYYIHIILFSLPLFLFFSIYLSVYLSSSPRLSSIRFFLHYFSRWFATRIPNFFSIFTHTFSLSLFLILSISLVLFQSNSVRKWSYSWNSHFNTLLFPARNRAPMSSSFLVTLSSYRLHIDRIYRYIYIYMNIFTMFSLESDDSSRLCF